MIEETFRLDELVDQVLRDLRLDVTMKISDIEMEPTAVSADPLRTRQIVRNLITNANRYGGDRVMVSVTPNGSPGVCR